MNEQALKDRLRTICIEKGIRFNECWKNLLLERFLSRLSSSAQSRNFIFKGGFLLAYMIEIGRETSDLDFLLTSVKTSEAEIKEAIEAIISTESNDGFLFEYEGIGLLDQPHMKCPGYRISLKVTFGRMKDIIQIDVGIGDVVKPTNRDFVLFQYRDKPMFEGEISLVVYPAETIFAEKLETVISKGRSNSRMKDYHDLLLLLRKPGLIDFDKLQATIKSTFQYRNTAVSLIDFDKSDLIPLEKLWLAHLKNLGSTARRALNLPEKIQDVIAEINEALSKKII